MNTRNVKKKEEMSENLADLAQIRLTLQKCSNAHLYWRFELAVRKKKKMGKNLGKMDYK
jgi:hypothetical protein